MMAVISIAATSGVAASGTVPPGAIENCPWGLPDEPGICYIPIRHVPAKDPAPQAGLPRRQVWCSDEGFNISLGTDGRTNVTTLRPICMTLYEQIVGGSTIILH